MNPQQGDDALDWTAFCYLAGDLNAQDVAEFELRLAEDQPAREALARAVELSQIVAAAESREACIGTVDRAHRSRTTWSTRFSWMAIGGLASLAAGLLVALQLGQFDRLIRQVSATNQFALATAWSEAGDELSQLTEVGLAPRALPQGSDADEDLTSSWVSHIDDPMQETPSWLTAAVSTQFVEAPEQTPGGTESL